MANSAENSSLESFTLKVSDKDLEATLELARASLLAQRTIAKHEQVPPAPSDYTGGLDSKTVDDLCTYFTSKYDWRTQEANFMNMGQHYRARIEDVPGEGPMSVYFVHAVCLNNPSRLGLHFMTFHRSSLPKLPMLYPCCLLMVGR